MNFETRSLSEENLVKRATRGDLEAFNQLVLMYQNVTYHHAYAILKDCALAEDATQDSFIQAFQSLAGFRGGSFRAWILKIVTNSAYDALRRLKRHPIQSLLPDDEYGGEIESPTRLADPTVSVENIVEQAEFFTDLSRLLAELPAVYHEVLTLIDVYEFDYAEAAQLLNVPIGTVKSRLARARLQMSRKLCNAKKYVVLPASSSVRDSI
ncbi:MAG TPA: sigma-70 family RNA polymerase sigma factor [Anaerolineales bacterium]|nr:sigma-70 family RNA polymerase sigma factor [Anaerolineales bacterium]